MGIFRSITATMAVVTLLASAASGLSREANKSEESIRRFQNAVTAYLMLRDAVTKTLPPGEMSPDPENFMTTVDAAAAALREARPFAAEGDLINAEAGALFRQRIRTTLVDSGCTVAHILADERDDERAPLPPRPIVHDYFDWSWGSFMPACVLSVLPPLPDQLQYRFVQRDLVLVDVGADLVVDVLPDALPASESWTGVLYAASSGTTGP